MKHISRKRTVPRALTLSCMLLALVGCKPPSITSSSIKERCRAVEAMEFTNQLVFTKLAMEDPAYEVRAAATTRLTDQTMLAKLAQEDPQDVVRVAAVAKLTNQTLLEQVAFDGAGNEHVRGNAIEKLTNRVTLNKLVETFDSNDKFGRLNTRTFKRIDELRELRFHEMSQRIPKAEEDELVKLALEDMDAVVRLMAMERLTNPATIEDMARNIFLPLDVRHDAISSLTNQLVLARIVMEDTKEYLSRWALSTLERHDSQGAKLWIALEMKVEKITGRVPKITGRTGTVDHPGARIDEHPSDREILREDILDNLRDYISIVEKTAAHQLPEYVQAAAIWRKASLASASYYVSRDHRIMLAVARLLRALNDPSVYPDIGGVSISVKREELSEQYTTLERHVVGVVAGEKITFSAEGDLLSNNGHLRTMWTCVVQSLFPEKLPPPFVEADLRLPRLLVEILRGFPQSRLEELALTSRCEDIRWAATVVATNQAVMKTLAVSDRDKDVREEAIGKVSDVATLAWLAENDLDPHLRLVAEIHLAHVRSNNGVSH